MLSRALTTHHNVMSDVPNDLIDTTEASKLASVSKATIRRWCSEGKLPSWRVGGRWRVSRADVIGCVAVYVPVAGVMSVAERRRREREVDAGLRASGVRK